MAEALILVLLSKIATTLGKAALNGIKSRLGKEIIILFQVENSMKEIESEFEIMQAYISQVQLQNRNNQIFVSWLKLVRKIAFEVEDIIDEYAFLLGKMGGTESFLKKTFCHSKNRTTWHNVSSQLQLVKIRLQHMTVMRERYGIKISDNGQKTLSNNINRQIYLSDSSYFNIDDDDDDAIVGQQGYAQKLIDCLNDNSVDRAIISILGMGGSGKTTLASSIWRRHDILNNFKCHAWVSVSQNYQIENLLSKILNQLDSKSMGHAIDDHNAMVVKIRSYLMDKKYLIVLDNMWDKDSWLLFDRAFPNNVFGSRVIITTRIEGTALLAQGNNSIRIGFLSPDDSWKLFCKKAFSKLTEAECPASLKTQADRILAKCQNLPLAIEAIGSLLSCRGMDEQEWASFYDQLNWQVTNNPELSWVSDVIHLSLNDLPKHLMNCFLYCGLFPEDSPIRRKWIIRMWIAEGFVEDRGTDTTPEEVAEEYLKELTQRSLIEVVDRNVFGRARRFELHNMVKEIIRTTSRKQLFALTCEHQDVTSLGDAARRVSVNTGGQDFQPGAAWQQLRSFLLFDRCMTVPWISTAVSSFRLLRVLCLRYSLLQEFPNAIAGLFNLYYLDLSRTKVKRIPKSVARLKNLQTLHLRDTSVNKLPREITQLTSLRHLFVSKGLYGTSIPGNIGVLKCLQTLREVKASKDLVENLGHLTQLRTLSITNVSTGHAKDLWTSIRKMAKLTRLAVSTHGMNEVLSLEKFRAPRYLQKFYLYGRLAEGVIFPVSGHFQNLKILSMRWSGLTQDPLGSLSQMPSLVYLELCEAYGGEALVFQDGWLPKLRQLYLIRLQNLNSLEISDGAMTNLAYLELRALKNLKAVPKGLEFLRLLKHLRAEKMPGGFTDGITGDQAFLERVEVECW